MTPREAAVVEEVARGYSNKHIGAILGIAAGTVSSHVAAAARKLGCRRRIELLAREYPFGIKGLPSSLTAAERHVVALVVRGSTTAAIARERNTSPRTISNQLASVYRKLAVNTREELFAALAGSGSSRVDAAVNPTIGGP